MKVNLKLLPIVLGCVLTLVSFCAAAGNGNGKIPPGQAKKSGKSNKAEAPFDAGLSLVIGTGVAYSLKRARDSRKKKLESAGAL